MTWEWLLVVVSVSLLTTLTITFIAAWWEGRR